MAEVKVLWTLTATKQRAQILRYWNERNGNNNYSRKLLGKVKERIQLLKKNPAIGKPTELKSTCILVMGHYSIIYKYFSFQILVTGFWDNRRDPAQLLRFLKKD